MRDGIADQHDPIKHFPLRLFKVAKWIAPSEKGLRALICEVIRKPVNISSTTEHYVTCDAVRLEGDTWVNLWSRCYCPRQQANKQIFHQAFKCRDCAQKNAFIE